MKPLILWLKEYVFSQVFLVPLFSFKVVIQKLFVFTVGELDATGIGISIDHELRQLLRTAAKDMPFAHHDYRRFRRVRVIEFGERGSVQVLPKCQVGPLKERWKFSIFKSSGRSKFTFAGMHNLSLSTQLVIFILLGKSKTETYLQIHLRQFEGTEYAASKGKKS